jgi:hypothetical protein
MFHLFCEFYEEIEQLKGTHTDGKTSQVLGLMTVLPEN